MTGAVYDLVAAELAQPADPQAVKMARALAATYPGAARAVLFYGSCLRESRLDGLMLDFYLIVSDYRAAYHSRWLAAANRLVPPNVFPFEHDGLIAKYAVLSEEDFTRLCGAEADTVSVWARFAQPSRLVWVADPAAAQVATAAVARAVPTLLSLAAPQAQLRSADPWGTGFALTYGAEIRAERKGRSQSIISSEAERYHAFYAAAVSDGVVDADRRWAPAEIAANGRLWNHLQRRGKWLTVVRLTKASFTFSGGIDYLAWKINRHAGANITLKPWQRRWPLLGALSLLPRLFGTGAIR